MSTKNKCVALIVSLCLTLAVTASDTALFEKNERVCFLGDSITHGGTFHSEVLLFLATRYPDTPVAFFNCGVAGDTASEALRRLQWDVLACKPSTVVVMMGMNDVGRWLYGKKEANPALLKQRKDKIEQYRQSMRKIVSTLLGKGIKVILCTPTAYDQTCRKKSANLTGVNDALAECAEIVREIAKENRLRLVDFHKHMNKVNQEQQAENPRFTMMDSARVHPDAKGHLLMACIFLKELDLPGAVSLIDINAATGNGKSSEGCTVSDINFSGVQLSFKVAPQALPFPISNDLAAVTVWVPFYEDINREILRVKKLKAGKWNLFIDGKPVGEYTSVDLEKGVNLAKNSKTPQYRLAARAREANKDRAALEKKSIRVFAALEHDVLRKKDINLQDMDAVKKALSSAIAEETRKKSWRARYFSNLSKSYISQKPQQDKTQKKLSAMISDLFKKCKPSAHTYKLQHVPAD